MCWAAAPTLALYGRLRARETPPDHRDQTGLGGAQAGS